tara:strand:+ start:121 stop:537 length:417 start_codon:yes stop_codon:yes gene_type:complete
MEQTQPSKMKYIGAWLLTGIIASILGRIADTVIANAMVNDLGDLNAYFIVVAAVSIPIMSGSFIFVYNLFKSLNVRKVMIYLYILGGLGALANIGKTAGTYQGMGVDLSIYFLSAIISVVVSVLLIRNYYIKKTDRWF